MRVLRCGQNLLGYQGAQLSSLGKDAEGRQAALQPQGVMGLALGWSVEYQASRALP